MPTWAAAALLPVVAALWAAYAYHRRSCLGVAVAAVGLFVPLAGGWTWLPDNARAVALAASPLAVLGAVLIARSWASSAGGKTLVLFLAAAVGVAILVHALAYNPFDDPGCVSSCEDVDPALSGALSTRAAVSAASLLTILAALLGAVAVLRESAPRLVVGAVLMTLLVIAGAAALRLTSWADPAHTELVVIAQSWAVAISCIAVCVMALRIRQARSAVDRLVRRLSAPHPAGDLDGVMFAVPNEQRWVDAFGRDIGNLRSEQAFIVLSDESGPVLRLPIPPSADAAEVLATLTPGTRLALQNARLSAAAKARLAEVQASQRRIVAMSDEERRRIERDLHDGAQQRLVSAAFHLRVALADADEATVQRLQTAENRVRHALARLRHLAHGAFPSVLADEGLAAALDDLVATADVPSTTDVQVRGQIGADAAMAAYATISTVLRLIEPAAGTRAHISVHQSDNALSVSVEVETGNGTLVAADFTNAADRVGALGGRFTMSKSSTEKLVVAAVIPCGS